MNRRRIVVAGIVVVAGAVAAAAIVATDDQTSTSADELPAVVATVAVEQRDVVTFDEATATLGYTASVTVSSPVTGTVTSIVGEGAEIGPGTVVATIDGEPVVALIGDIPGWRDLSSDSIAGIDVRQLEANLVSLGFDPDGAIVIDSTYDDATEDAVTAWEIALGLDGDGEVPQRQIVFVPGSLLVDEVAVPIGGAATVGGELLTARQVERRFLVSTPGASVVGDIASSATPVTTGTILFSNDSLPVVAIEGDQSAVAALSRELEVGSDDGADVKLLERMLVTGGHDPNGAIVIDDEFDLATAEAVLRWWQSFDSAITVDPVDLVVPAGSFVVVPAGLEMGAGLVDDGALIGGDAVVATLTSPARAVTTSAPIDDATFALGAVIDVEFPDGTIEPGTVVEVGNVASNSTGVPGATPSVSIVIHVETIPESVASFVSVPVTLRVVADSVPGALVVPVSALVALAEGGYALEVVDAQATATAAARTHLIAVETGLFADGFVVVTGADIVVGLDVVVPS
jgi:membrane fusion protein, multidrug efflux system